MEPPIYFLPPEILLKIFEECGYYDRHAFALVSRYFRELVFRHKKTLRHVNPITMKLLKQFPQIINHVKSFNLYLLPEAINQSYLERNPFKICDPYLDDFYRHLVNASNLKELKIVSISSVAEFNCLSRILTSISQQKKSSLTEIALAFGKLYDEELNIEQVPSNELTRIEEEKNFTFPPGLKKLHLDFKPFMSTDVKADEILASIISPSTSTIESLVINYGIRDARKWLISSSCKEKLYITSRASKPRNESYYSSYEHRPVEFPNNYPPRMNDFRIPSIASATLTSLNYWSNRIHPPHVDPGNRGEIEIGDICDLWPNLVNLTFLIYAGYHQKQEKLYNFEELRCLSKCKELKHLELNGLDFPDVQGAYDYQDNDCDILAEETKRMQEQFGLTKLKMLAWCRPSGFDDSWVIGYFFDNQGQGLEFHDMDAYDGFMSTRRNNLGIPFDYAQKLQS